MSAATTPAATTPAATTPAATTPTGQRWSTAAVARIARISSRTLRHYHHIGLLLPAGTGHGGLRWYERPQLLRLQHIRLLRELGLGLDDIAAVLDGVTDEIAMLRRHHDRLLSEAERLLQLADTVERSITERAGGTEMTAEELFEGFGNDPYAAEARERYGAVAEESQRVVARWDGVTAARVRAEGESVNRRIAAAMRAGTPADDPVVQDLVAEHHAWVCHFWTPNAEAYAGLGRLYVDDERFTAGIDAVAAGLAAYLREAMAEFARTRLGR